MERPRFGAAHGPKPEKVHNVILMIGDGMGLGQVAAYMIENQYGPTAFDRAHYTAVCKTYSANNRVTDSGAAATAMASGHKTKNSRIGVTPDGAPAQSITELAKAKGLATGIVVTSHLADATPAGFMAHTPDRHNTSEIAAAYETSGIDVAAGGGRRFFEKQENGQDVLAALQAKGYAYASTPEEFYATDSTPVIGLFADKYMESAAKRGEDYLERATEHTLSLLARNRKGFFAMIEGSQIDGAGHGNNTKKTAGRDAGFRPGREQGLRLRRQKSRHTGHRHRRPRDRRTDGRLQRPGFHGGGERHRIQVQHDQPFGHARHTLRLRRRGIQFQRRNRKY